MHCAIEHIFKLLEISSWPAWKPGYAITSCAILSWCDCIQSYPSSCFSSSLSQTRLTSQIIHAMRRYEVSIWLLMCAGLIGYSYGIFENPNLSLDQVKVKLPSSQDLFGRTLFSDPNLKYNLSSWVPQVIGLAVTTLVPADMREHWFSLSLMYSILHRSKRVMGVHCQSYLVTELQKFSSPLLWLYLSTRTIIWSCLCR